MHIFTTPEPCKFKGFKSERMKKYNTCNGWDFLFVILDEICLELQDIHNEIKLLKENKND